MQLYCNHTKITATMHSFFGAFGIRNVVRQLFYKKKNNFIAHLNTTLHICRLISLPKKIQFILIIRFKRVEKGMNYLFSFILKWQKVVKGNKNNNNNNRALRLKLNFNLIIIDQRMPLISLQKPIILGHISASWNQLLKMQRTFDFDSKNATFVYYFICITRFQLYI